MESANYLPSSTSSSSSLSTPPSSYVTSASATNWPQNYNLNSTTVVGLNPRQQKHEISNPHNFNNLMIQDLSFHYNHDDDKIKEELSISSSDNFPKFSEMLLNTNEDQQRYMNDLSEKLLLKTISSGFDINQFSSPIYSTTVLPNNNYGRGNFNFSQIYPSINISNLNRSPPRTQQPSPAAFDMNLQALDLLTSTRFSGNFEQPNFHDHFNNVIQHQQHLSHFPSSNPTKIPSSVAATAAFTTTNETITEAKRPSSNTFIDPKATQSAPKKSRLDSRASCPPFKVRKEKLGDRIANLQQLVAPFGKTDTASVLMEAIGYIKFLQNQVETLSVPYMKSSRNKSSRPTQAFQGSTMEEGNDHERKKDLRSRGLCLVPLSCMSYVTGDGGGGGSGGGIWPPPNFG